MKTRLLIVDDEKEILLTLEKLFLTHNFEIKIAEGATQALQILDENKIDIALLDINMPGMDGISLLEQIKKRDFSIQVIMMTGYSTFKKTLRALEMGAADYVLKPFSNFNELLELVNESARRITRWRNIMSDSVKKKMETS